MNLPFPDNTFDHVYVIEAACHAPEKVRHRKTNSFLFRDHI